MYMRSIFLLMLLAVPAAAFAQDDVKPLFAVDRALSDATSQKGMRNGFLEFLAADSVVFKPEAVNGVEFWKSQPAEPSPRMLRKTIYADISSSGILGYTTGTWQMFTQGKGELLEDFGQYLTIWQKGLDGRYKAEVNIEIGHDKLGSADTDKKLFGKMTCDPNKREWSPADASMNFLKMSMNQARLGAAYEQFAADDVRVLVEREPPILGKKKVVQEMSRYKSIEFPKKVALFQSTDLAYTWNPCQYVNNDEGTESGNCLHVWKLRKKKWYIVVGVFARQKVTIPPPTLKVTADKKK